MTVIGARRSGFLRYVGGAGFAQAESASQRDPCGQDSSALACTMQPGQSTLPAGVVLTAGTAVDPTLSRSAAADLLQGAAARLGNLAFNSAPVMWLFDADPDFQWFTVPNSPAGTNGATVGNVGYLLGGAAGIIRRGGADLIAAGPSRIARALQGTPKYPGIDRFRDILLRKGTVIYGGHPGQSAFYTTASALRRSGNSASALFDGLQVLRHRNLGYRTRFAAYEVLEDTPAAFGLAIANVDNGAGWLPQIVVPSFQTTLRYLSDFPLAP